jgi:hypothetical protein
LKAGQASTWTLLKIKPACARARAAVDPECAEMAQTQRRIESERRLKTADRHY